MSSYKPLMESCIGIGGAVSGNQQLRAVEIGRIHRNQLNLDRPLRKPALLRGAMRFFMGFLRMLDLPRLASRAATGQGHALFLHLFLFIFHHGLLVISCRLALYKGNRPRGTGGQTVAQPIAIIIPHQLRLAVHHSDSTFVAGLSASPATVAFFFVNLNDSTDHF